MKEFKVEDSFEDDDKTYLIGTVENKLTKLKLIEFNDLEEKDSDYFEKKHTIISKNDIYYFMEVENDYMYNYENEINCLENKSIGYKYVCSDYETYLKNKVNCINKIKYNNIIDENEDFILIKKCSFKNNNSYWILIFKDKNYMNIRDLRTTEPLIKAREYVLSKMNELNIEKDKILMYFDLKTNNTEMFLNIINLKKGINNVYKAYSYVLLDLCIKNINIDKDYYKKPVYYYEEIVINN